MLTYIRCPFHPRVTAVVRNRPRSFCQKCRWQFTPKHTHTSLTQRNRSGLTMPLSRHSVGTYPETSSYATCRGTFGHTRLRSLSHCGLIDPSIQSRIRARELISTGRKKKKEKCRRGMNGRTFSQNLRKRGKMLPPKQPVSWNSRLSISCVQWRNTGAFLPI